jgi:hypothetical protein
MPHEQGRDLRWNGGEPTSLYQAVNGSHRVLSLPAPGCRRQTAPAAVARFGLPPLRMPYPPARAASLRSLTRRSAHLLISAAMEGTKMRGSMITQSSADRAVVPKTEAKKGT